MNAWQKKAERLVAAACRESYIKANTRPDGQRYKRHRPYSVPDYAEQLLAALNANDEHTAKSLMMCDGEWRELERRAAQ